MGKNYEQLPIRDHRRKGRNGSYNVLPVMEGLPVKEFVDPAVTLAAINEIYSIRVHGAAPHRGRERRGSGPALEERLTRHVSRRGQWKS